MTEGSRPVQPLFEPFRLKNLELRNRIVLPPMSFHAGREGVPGQDVIDYYRKRAEGGAGLLLTEGIYVDHSAASDKDHVLRFHTDAALQAWGTLAGQVHEAGGLIMPQLFHNGLMYDQVEMVKGREVSYDPAKGEIGPSGYIHPGVKVRDEMTQAEIDGAIDAFARGGENAKRLGFDGVEIHGAHGYLVDQFFWEKTNMRGDGYGGSIRNRARFAEDIVREIRRRVGPDFPILMRLSQWKLQDYGAKVANDPQELEALLAPLIDAGVDMFDGSQRRYWLPEFPGSDLNFAGWIKKISGKPVITVGSVGLSADMTQSFESVMDAEIVNLDRLMERFGRDEFDLVAVGRALIADAEWPNKIREGRTSELRKFSVSILAQSPGNADVLR